MDNKEIKEYKKEEELKPIMEDIKNILEKFVNKQNSLCIDYAVICNCAIKLLDAIFGKDKYELPIDINYIYKEMDIPLLEMDLNSYMDGFTPKRVNRIIGKISIRNDFISGKMKRSVYIDENTPPILQRYAMAHELCHYILQMDEVFTDEYCNMPMLPKDPAELVADAFAIFLLIPIKPFMDEFLKYVNRERRSGRPPFRTSEWIEHLSAVCYVAEDYVAYGYELIRYIASWLYSVKDREECPDDNVKELWGKRKEYLSQEIIESLYS